MPSFCPAGEGGHLPDSMLRTAIDKGSYTHAANFLRTALCLTFAGAFASFNRLTAGETGKCKITGMKLKPISGIGHTIFRSCRP